MEKLDYRDFEFRIFDLHEGKVLYGDDIPILAKGLNESIRQFSGQTYALSQYTDNKDIRDNKIYEGDILSIYKLPKNMIVPLNKIEDELKPIGRGLVQYFSGAPLVQAESDHEIVLINLSTGEGNLEFKVIGNHLENKELYPIYVNEEYYSN